MLSPLFWQATAAFDTWGELLVIFTAGIAAVGIAALGKSTSLALQPQDHNPILRESVSLLIPLVLLYALYVQFHGDIGPGGGFQAGIVFAIGIISYGLVFGLQRMLRIVSLRGAEVLGLSWRVALWWNRLLRFACLEAIF